MFFMKSKKRDKKSSELSIFIREAKSRDKKKIYKRVIEKAIREQHDVLANRNAQSRGQTNQR